MVVTYTERSLGSTTNSERGAITVNTNVARTISATVFAVATTLATITVSSCVTLEPTIYNHTAPIISDVYLVKGYKLDDTDPRGYSASSTLNFTTNIQGTTKIRWGLLPDPATWTYDDLIDPSFVTTHVIEAADGMHGGGHFYYQAWSQSRDGLWGHSDVILDTDNVQINQPPIVP